MHFFDGRGTHSSLSLYQIALNTSFTIFDVVDIPNLYVCKVNIRECAATSEVSIKHKDNRELILITGRQLQRKWKNLRDCLLPKGS
jgi:hypothetical protein